MIRTWSWWDEDDGGWAAGEVGEIGSVEGFGARRCCGVEVCCHEGCRVHGVMLGTEGFVWEVGGVG